MGQKFQKVIKQNGKTVRKIGKEAKHGVNSGKKWQEAAKMVVKV